MFIYNVTVNVELSIIDEWLNWMKHDHIPAVMQTGLFLDNKVFEVMVQEEQGRTFSVQYGVKDLETLELYNQVYAEKLKQESFKKFGDRALAFRSILRLEQEYKP
jgi:hypothetical protein